MLSCRLESFIAGFGSSVADDFVRASSKFALARASATHATARSIKTTAEHPFFVAGQNEFVPAGELQVGDLLISHDDQLIEVTEVRSTDEVTTVYNLRVADHHTYFVGGTIWAFDVWVHNANYFKYLREHEVKSGWFAKGGDAIPGTHWTNYPQIPRNSPEAWTIGKEFANDPPVTLIMANIPDSLMQRIDTSRSLISDYVLKATIPRNVILEIEMRNHGSDNYINVVSGLKIIRP